MTLKVSCLVFDPGKDRAEFVDRWRNLLTVFSNLRKCLLTGLNDLHSA